MDFDEIFQQINLRYQRAIWDSAILTLNRMNVDIYFLIVVIYINTALPFPLQNIVQRLRSYTTSSVFSTPSEVSAILCILFGNPLRALFLKNRDSFCYSEIFGPNMREPLGCLLGFWPSVTEPCGGTVLLFCCRCFSFFFLLLFCFAFCRFVNFSEAISIGNPTPFIKVRD